MLIALARELGVSTSSLDHLTPDQVSDPISVNGNYFLLQLSSRTPTPYDKAKPAVSQAAQAAGSQVAQRAITTAERRASVSVDPRYGTWVPVTASVFTPFTPRVSDVLNPGANETGLTTSPSSGTSSG